MPSGYPLGILFSMTSFFKTTLLLLALSLQAMAHGNIVCQQAIAQEDTISTAAQKLPPSQGGSGWVFPHREGQGESHWGVRFQGRAGKVLVMDEYQRRWQKDKNTSNYDLQFVRTWLPSDSDAFAKDFNYPNITIGLRYDNYHNVSMHRNEDPAWGLLEPVDYDSYMSDMFTLYGKFERPLLRTKHWLIDYQLGTGVGYCAKKYNTTDCIDNELIGSHLNIFFTAGVTATYRVARDWGITTGIEFAHHSNGALARPNKGVNSLAPLIGVTYCPYYEAQQKEPLAQSQSKTQSQGQGQSPSASQRSHAPHWYANIDLGIGGKTLLEDWLYTQFNTPPGEADYRTEKFNTYLACALSAHAMYRYQRRWASGLGIDVFHASYSNREAQIDDKYGYTGAKHSPWSIGLSAHHEVFFGRLSVPMSLGYYLFREMGEKAKQNEKRYYERIGVRYRPFGKKHEQAEGWKSFTSGIAFGFNINAHATKADYTEFLISVPIM